MKTRATNKQFLYQARAYDLDIRSDIALPEFLPSNGGMDVAVVLEKESVEVDCIRPKWDLQPSAAECCFPGVGRFRIIGGCEIRITPAPDVDPGLIRLYVEGMMMAILLHQRGYFVLHASVVEVDGRGVAFVGPVGAGKSSVAMALHTMGHSVVTDDNAAIRVTRDSAAVLPAFPRIKVYPAIAASLGIDGTALDDLHISQVKKTKSVENGFAAHPVPLDRIYALSREATSIVKLSRPEAVVELVKHSIPARWALAGTPEQLRDCARLSGMIPVFRVRTFEKLESLADIARNIEDHVRPRGVRAAGAAASAILADAG